MNEHETGDEAEERRRRTHNAAVRRAADLIHKTIVTPPRTSAARAHARNRIQAAIERADRIGAPLGLTFSKTTQAMINRRSTRWRLVRLGRALVTVGLALLGFALAAYLAFQLLR